MITARTYLKGTVTEIDPTEVSEAILRPEELVWVDVVAPTEDDLSLLQDEFSLHALAMEDVRHRNQRPKLEHYDTHAFLVAYTAYQQEVDVFIGPCWLITVRDDEDGASFIEGARRRIERIPPDDVTVGFAVYLVLDELVDGYFVRNDEVEDELEDLEERIFAEGPLDERIIQQKLFDVRRRLLAYRRLAVPMRDVLTGLLRGDVEWVDANTRTYLQDVFDHVLRVIDTVDNHRELMGNAVDAHLAIISNRMNSVMKRMTSWGAILLGSTLVAGIYGMNFEHMPELGWRLGYPFALGIMATITVVGYRMFKRNDWL